MARKRDCRTCVHAFTPRRARPWRRRCDDCRAPVVRHGAITTYNLGPLGLWRGPEGIAMQASVAGGTRTDPSKFSDAQLEALRRRHLPTEDERVEDAEQARRRRALAYIATPIQAAVAAAIEPEGDQL